MYKVLDVFLPNKPTFILPSANPKNISWVFFFFYIIQVGLAFCSNLLQIDFLSPQFDPNL